MRLNGKNTTCKLRPSAQYRLDLYDTEGKLLHSEVISNGNSQSTKNVVVSHNTRGTDYQASANSPSLIAYPNPSEKGMAVTFELQNIEADKFNIQVLDKAGRIITQHQQLMDKSNNQWQHTFYTAGSYTVIFYTTQIKLTQTVVIK